MKEASAGSDARFGRGTTLAQCPTAWVCLGGHTARKATPLSSERWGGSEPITQGHSSISHEIQSAQEQNFHCSLDSFGARSIDLVGSTFDGAAHARDSVQFTFTGDGQPG